MVSIDHYRQELIAQMDRATKSGATDVLINALNLSDSISKGRYQTESCCEAMHDEIKTGDVLIIARTHSAGMTVRYRLPRN
jgi:hypothetical protein